MPKKLSPAQIKVLRAADTGTVYRPTFLNYNGNWYIQRGRAVTATVRALLRQHLLAIDHAGRDPRAVLTDAGRAALEAVSDA